MESKEGKLISAPITETLLRLAMPIVAACFLSTAYSITDMAWIGQLGTEVLTGVGVASMYVWLSQGLATLAQMGGQVLVAQELGRGNKEAAEKYAQASIQLTLIFGIFFGALCLFFTDGMIAFFGVKGETAVAAAETYLRVTCGLILFSYLGQVLTGIYTAQGDSRTPFLANLIGLVLNMILDPLLILGKVGFPRLETLGAAIATVVAQMIVFLVLLWGIYRKNSDHVLKHAKWLQKAEQDYVKQIIRIGGPSAIQGTIYCMISMALSRMSGRFGDTAIAVLRVGGQIESVAWNIAKGASNAINAFVAQNFGAGRMDRVKEGYRISFWAVTIWSGLVTLVFLIFPEHIASVFFHESKEVELFAGYLIVLAFSEIFNCVEMLAIGAISGLGNTKLCSMISVIFTGMRIPIAMVLCDTSLGVTGIWWALTISTILKGVILHAAFYRECRKFPE